jgi:hypothetical protein
MDGPLLQWHCKCNAPERRLAVTIFIAVGLWLAGWLEASACIQGQQPALEHWMDTEAWLV